MLDFIHIKPFLLALISQNTRVSKTKNIILITQVNADDKYGKNIK
jgi:hypothetical protein